MTQKPKQVRPVHPNIGLEIEYRNILKKLIKEMNDSILYWMKAAYRKAPPSITFLTNDASPSDEINKAFQSVAKRQQEKFDEDSKKIASRYLKKMFDATDNALARALNDAGLSVVFGVTKGTRDIYNAVLQENIELIKSIPEEYLKDVQGVIMRAFSSGRDLQSMVRGIKEVYAVTDRRAILISRDQSNKATSVLTRARRIELGIKEAIWIHSRGGKTPRADHQAADGKKFDVEKGCLISGEYIQPGEKINCRCVSKAILPKIGG
jgi:uncharacterized protein with gpF-like domain